MPLLFCSYGISIFSCLNVYACNIIKGNIYVDANRVFSSSFVWADSAVAIFRNALTGNSKSYLSNIAAKKDSINAILANISNSIGG